MERIDLHLHSTASDGHFAPAEVAAQAAAANLHIIALTDHDTAAGVRELQAAALPLKLIPGIEISSTHEGRDVHMLGYYIDAAHPSILAHEERARDGRNIRMRKMIAKLAALGVHVSFEEVQAAAGEGDVLGRPHLARVMVDLGYVASHSQAFDKYIGDDGPAFSPTELVTPGDAIRIIHEAGGLAVWAHPRPDAFERELPRLQAWGLDGVECFRPRVQPADALRMDERARSLGLVVTGGSDWHGVWQGRLGDFSVTRDEVGAFLDLGGI